jgi:hypothetical protein
MVLQKAYRERVGSYVGTFVITVDILNEWYSKLGLLAHDNAEFKNKCTFALSHYF